MSDQYPPAPGSSPEPPGNPYETPNPYGQPPTPMPGYGVPGTPMPGEYGLGYAEVPRYASWIKRVAATIIDSIVMFAAGIPFLIPYVQWMGRASQTATTDPVTGQTTFTEAPTGAELGVMAVGALFALGVSIWNLYLRQGRTGQTVGKSALGITLISERTRQPIGAGMAFVRYLAHFIDQIPCYVGYLWPLWDAKRQTFADKILSTIVVEKN